MKRNVMAALAVLATVSLTGCNSQSGQKSKEQKETTCLFGTYKGTFPCADCGGKDMNLTISEDGTYCLKYQYQDKEARLIEENGTYELLNKTLVVTVTPSSGERTYYKYMNGHLVLSDSLGTVDNGELAEFYILKK